MPLSLRCSVLCLLFALATQTAEAKLHLRPDVSGRATVHFLGAAPGKYALVADNGAIYEPTNLKRAYQADGIRVKFTGKLLVRPAPLIAGARVVRITNIHGLAVSTIRPAPTGYPRIPKSP